MFRPLLFAALYLLAGASQAGGQLTAQEIRWLRAAGPVLVLAQRLELPIDITVQPQARPNDVPMAMGFDGGRCKLVLSMRGNPAAEEVLAVVPQDEQGLLIEAMAAHEVGHCWRYVQGKWHALPAGFVEAGEQKAQDAGLLKEAQQVREDRREEGYADLVALAWVQRFHPQDYQRVHAWMAKLRAAQPVDGGSHDTRTWVQLARDGAVFGAAAHPFAAAAPVWQRGLLSGG